MNKERETKFKVLCGTLYSMMIIDYILTYIAVAKLGILPEANPFMVWLFELPFITGIILRLIMAAIMIYLIVMVYDAKHKARYPLVIFAIATNLAPLYGHAQWINAYVYLEYLQHL